MWKSHFSVDAKEIVFHRGCENLCGKLHQPVGKILADKVFHISTGRFLLDLLKCGKLELKIYVQRT